MVTSSAHYYDLLACKVLKITLKFPWVDTGLVDDLEVGELPTFGRGGCRWEVLEPRGNYPE